VFLVAEHLSKVLFDDMATRRCLAAHLANDHVGLKTLSPKKGAMKKGGDALSRVLEPEEQLELAFREAVWMLHGKVFRTYCKWAEKQVGLPLRPLEDQHFMDLCWTGGCPGSPSWLTVKGREGVCWESHVCICHT
jgi:hypothetical protein